MEEAKNDNSWEVQETNEMIEKENLGMGEPSYSG